MSRQTRFPSPVVESCLTAPFRETPLRGTLNWSAVKAPGQIRSNSEANYGFNAASGEFQDLVQAGVIDPTKVTRTALQNASSISALMLTTEAMSAEIPEKTPAGGGPGGPGGHGPDMDY